MATDYRSILNNLKETPPRDLNDHVLIIDAMNMLIRSFSLIKSMNPSGHHIGGLVGFLRSLAFVTRTFDPTRVIIVWDGKGGSANRKNIDSNYKAQRATTRITHWGLYENKAEETEALIGQLIRLQDYIACLPIHNLMMEKLEADDIIAFLAKKVSTAGKKCTIVSSDKDFLQLIDGYIEVYAPTKKVVFTKENIQEELQVHPTNYDIIKSLLGDNSDNLSGIKGLGIKTIISEFNRLVTEPDMTLQYVYDTCVANMEGKKVFAKIIYDWDRVETNYKLMSLHDSVLDENEIVHIFNVLKEHPGDLQTGAFMHLLIQDKVEGITKNTEGWLENFRGLTVFKK